MNRARHSAGMPAVGRVTTPWLRRIGVPLDTVARSRAFLGDASGLRRACGVLGVAMLFAAGVAAAVAQATDVKASPVAPNGQALFRAKCGVCHLDGGTGTFMLNRRLGAERALLEKRRDLDAAMITQVVRNGIVSMPRLTRAEVPDDELRAIAAYLTRKDSAESGQAR